MIIGGEAKTISYERKSGCASKLQAPSSTRPLTAHLDSTALAGQFDVDHISQGLLRVVRDAHLTDIGSIVERHPFVLRREAPGDGLRTNGSLERAREAGRDCGSWQGGMRENGTTEAGAATATQGLPASWQKGDHLAMSRRRGRECGSGTGVMGKRED